MRLDETIQEGVQRSAEGVQRETTQEGVQRAPRPFDLRGQGTQKNQKRETRKEWPGRWEKPREGTHATFRGGEVDRLS